MSHDAYEIDEAIPVYRGFFNLSKLKIRHRRFDGGWTPWLDRELFHRGRCVAVLPYDPVSDRVVLIEQFRVGALDGNADPWLLEIVAGAIEEGETPVDVAYREAKEEAGCRLLDLIPVYEFFPTPGGCSELVSLFCGLIDTTGVGGIHGVPEEHEDIRVHVLEFADAMQWLADGRIRTAVAIMGLQWLALNRDGLRAAAKA